MIALPFLASQKKPAEVANGVKSPAAPAQKPAAAQPAASRPSVHHSTSTQLLLEHERLRRMQLEQLVATKSQQNQHPGYQANYTYPTGYALIPGQPVAPSAPIYYAATPVYAQQPVCSHHGYASPVVPQPQQQQFAQQLYPSPQQLSSSVPLPQPVPQVQVQPLPQLYSQQPLQQQQVAAQQYYVQPQAGYPMPQSSVSMLPASSSPQQLPMQQVPQSSTPGSTTLPVVYLGQPAKGSTAVYAASDSWRAGPQAQTYSVPGQADPSSTASAAVPVVPTVVRVPGVRHNAPGPAPASKPAAVKSPSAKAPAKKPAEDLEDGWELVGTPTSNGISLRDKPSKEAKIASELSSSGSDTGGESKRDVETRNKQLAALELDTDMYILWTDIKLGRELGSGHFGAVYEAAWRGTTPVAVKMLHAHLKGDAIKNFAEEAKVWLRIPPHPNIVQFFGLSHSDASLVIITELLEGGSLLSFLQDPKSNLTTQQLLNISKNICAGMWHLHCASIVHRDLAARNILVGGYLPRSKSFIIKVSDFGLSRHCVGTAKQKTLIPFKWSAPESISKSLFSTASDVWSFGVVLSEVFSQGETPYPDLTEEQTVARIRLGYRMPKPLDCPADVYDIMLTCWRSDPSERPTMQELCSQLDQLEQRAAAGQLGPKPLPPPPTQSKPPAVAAAGSGNSIYSTEAKQLYAAPTYSKPGAVSLAPPAAIAKKPAAIPAEEQVDGRGYIVTP